MGNFEESSRMYVAALSVYHLMKIEIPFIAFSIYNRISKLYPHITTADLDDRIQAIIKLDESQGNIDKSPFAQGVEITRSAISTVNVN